MARLLFWLMWVPGLWFLYPFWISRVPGDVLDDYVWVRRVTDCHAIYSSVQVCAKLALVYHLLNI